MSNEYQILKNYTKNTALLWKQSRGIATDDVADKMDAAMLDWMVELTDCLGIWIEKGLQMTDGELILADTNIGALVESWLKFFYCVHYQDYVRERQNGAGRQPMREPEELRNILAKEDFGIQAQTGISGWIKSETEETEFTPSCSEI